MDSPNKLQMQPSDNTVEIDLLDLFRVLMSNIGKLIVSALIVGNLALAITIFLIAPKYRSSFTAFVNNKTSNSELSSSLQNGDITAAKNLTYTYAAIMKSRPVIEDALDKVGMQSRYSYDSIKSGVTTEIEANTQLVTVSVSSKSADDSYQIAKAISQLAPDYLASIVTGSSMKIVSNPIMPTAAYSPSVLKNTAIGILLGLLLMAAIVIIRHLADTRIGSEQALEELFSIPIIGTIPNFTEAASGKNARYKYYYKKGGKK